MRKSSWLLLGVSGLVGGVYEGIFLASAPAPFVYFRPILPVCVLLFLLNRRSAAYFLAVFSGAVIDLLSVPNSDFVMLRWLCVLLVVDLLAEKVATNRSLYASMLLILAARVMDRLLGLVLSLSAGLVLHQERILLSWRIFGGTLLGDMAMTAAAFILLSVFTKRFLVAINTKPTRYG